MRQKVVVSILTDSYVLDLKIQPPVGSVREFTFQALVCACLCFAHCVYRERED